MAEVEHRKDRRLQIKKYANRRYYDAANSRHLNLQDICCLVRQGQQLCIIDGTSSIDITSQVLAQILLEFEPEKLNVLPEGFLASLLRGKNPFAEKVLAPTAGASQSTEESVRTAPAAAQPARPAASPSELPAKGEAYDLLQALAVARERTRQTD